MEKIKKKYIFNKNKKPIAVQMDISTFEKIEQLLEDYALGQLMNVNDPEGYLSLEEASEIYFKSKDNLWLDIRIHRNFLKDIQSVPARERRRIESFVFHDLPGYNSLIEIPLKFKNFPGTKTILRFALEIID